MPTPLPHTLKMTHRKNQGDSRDTMDLNKWFKMRAVLQSSVNSQPRFWELKIIRKSQESYIRRSGLDSWNGQILAG